MFIAGRHTNVLKPQRGDMFIERGIHQYVIHVIRNT